MRSETAILICLLGILACACISPSESTELKLEGKQFCSNVESGAWPDYNNTFQYCPKK